ncbi:MAG: DoxX family protein [Ferruginibacter sp.]
MWKKIFSTGNESHLTIMRITLGIVMLGHGLQKSFGWFEGFGWANTIHYFTNTVGLPAALGGFVILIETIGAVMLILGMAGRINAALMIAVITGAFFVDHLPNGFFMNWFGNHQGEGYEFDLLFVAIALSIVMKGSGRFSMDKLLCSRF